VIDLEAGMVQTVECQRMDVWKYLDLYVLVTEGGLVYMNTRRCNGGRIVDDSKRRAKPFVVLESRGCR
jgi:hypothetical protein